MANHALKINSMTQFGKLAATFHLVAGEALGGELSQFPLRFMHVMAGGASHGCAGLETAASLQELHGATMHIHMGVRGGFGNKQKIVKHAAGRERQ